MPEFKFKIKFNSKVKVLEGLELVSTIECDHPNRNLGPLRYEKGKNTDTQLETLAELISSPFEEEKVMSSVTIASRTFGEQLFTEGEKIIPVDYYLALRGIEERDGVLTVEILKNEDWVKSCKPSDELPEGAVF